MLTHWNYVFLALTHRHVMDDTEQFHLHSQNSKPWLLTWGRKEPGHQQQWWWPAIFWPEKYEHRTVELTVWYIRLTARGRHQIQTHVLERLRFDGLVQERRNSSALAMELRLSCTNLSVRCLKLESISLEVNPLCLTDIMTSDVTIWKCTRNMRYWIYAQHKQPVQSIYIHHAASSQVPSCQGLDRMAAILQTTFSNVYNILNGDVWIANKFSIKFVPLNDWIAIEISLKFGLWGPIDYKLVNTGAGMTSHYLNQWWSMNQFNDAYMRHHLCVTGPQWV